MRVLFGALLMSFAASSFAQAFDQDANNRGFHCQAVSFQVERIVRARDTGAETEEHLLASYEWESKNMPPLQGGVGSMSYMLTKKIFEHGYLKGKTPREARGMMLDECMRALSKKP